MKIKATHFCSLSTSKDWKDWLKSQNNELYLELIKTTETSKGCRANKEVMMKIYNQLYKLGHNQAFEEFISHRFPYIIEPERPEVRDQRQKAEKQVQKKQEKKKKEQAGKNANYYQVFKSYKPEILTFPQKMIIRAPNNLQDKINNFIADKTGVDYLIIGDTAYIEYFHSKYVDVVDKIPRQNREIYQYRMSLGA